MAEKKEEPPKPRRRVKKVKGHGGHHGGAWKVAYADFVTAMMALFLVLWLVSQADTKLKEAIASYFRSPGVFDSIKGGILTQAKKVSKEPTSLTSKDDEQTLFSVADNLKKKFSTRPEFTQYKDQIKVEVSEEGLKIQIIDKADQVSFSSGSADLNEEAKAVLTEIANGICDLPNKITIGGHTDSRVFPSKNGYTNWELSTDRANAARRILESVCVEPSQIHRVIGYADTDPMIPEDPNAPANRRISITVLRLENTPNNNEKPTDSPDAEATPVSKTNKVIENKPTTKPAIEKSEVPKAISNSTTPPDDKIKTTSNPAAEKSDAKNTLKKEGAITVGEPDTIPNKPKVKPER